MNVVAIIPARGGSTRIPRKNLKLFHGQPIIAYSMGNAWASGLFDRVIVTTDDEDIAAVALAGGCEVFMRSAEMSQDSVGTQEVVRDCLVGMGIESTAIVCCIYATAPLMSISDLKRGAGCLTMPATEFVFSVGLDPVHDAGQFYWGLAGSFINRAPLISPRSRMIPVSSFRDCDINTMDDWNRALKLYEGLSHE